MAAATTEIRSPTTMSFEEFLKLELPEGIHAEWVDGRVEYMSPVEEGHESLTGWLYALLRAYVEEKQLGRILGAPFLMRLETRPSGREPDILFVSKDRMDLVERMLLNGPADLAIEVISPDSVRRDRRDKFYEYETAGVREYWLLDPKRKKAEFHRLGTDGDYHPVMIEDGVFHSEVIEGLWIRESWLWQDPKPMLISILRTWGLV